MEAIVSAIGTEAVAQGGGDGERVDILCAAQNDFEERRRKLLPFKMNASMGERESGSITSPRSCRFEIHGGRCRGATGRQLIVVGRIMCRRVGA